jgi:hypothetical protein
VVGAPAVFNVNDDDISTGGDGEGGGGGAGGLRGRGGYVPRAWDDSPLPPMGLDTGGTGGGGSGGTGRGLHSSTSHLNLSRF